MTEEKDNKTKSRSKLTLKLKPSGDSNKTIGVKNSDNKVKQGSVQVTIKGRKSRSVQKKTEENNISAKEFESRYKIISGKSYDKSTADLDVIAKIKEEELKKEKELADKKETIKKPTEKSEKKSEVIVEEKAKIKANEVKNSIEVDDHDVFNKIKQSVKASNKEKEEREKLLEEKRRKEIERLEKEKQERAKNQKFEEDGFKKSKKRHETKDRNRSNKRKLTYIIDSDSEFEGGYRKKKKKKGEIREINQEEKEYKKVSREVLLPELITVAELSDRMSEKAGDVVKKLFTMGMVATSNQVIDADTAELIIEEFGHTVKRVADSDVESVLKDEDDPNLEKKSRAPVVTIMGHVDHGKTSLLDAMRSTKIAAGEHGGITQHIGASRIKTKNGQYITFLDTPGHEAFTEMRLRGANATDIVILVVAADDGVKEQTIEAISHAKAAEAPIIVAVNKIDAPGADSSRVKNELLSHDIIPEDMGGDCMFVEVSAKEKTNLDQLEEAILLQAEVLDLQAPYEGKSSGVIIESRVDPNKGVVATALVQKGTLDISDLIVVDTSYGKIRKMTDDRGKNIKIATPSVPVEILGLNEAPNSGEKFFEVEEEKTARDIISYREKKKREEKAMQNSVKSISDIFKDAGKNRVKNLNIIIKADVHGSVEAIASSILKLNNDEVAIKIVHQATGGINESDVSLASVSNAVIIGFNVRSTQAAKNQAEEKSVELRYYSVIYNIIDDLKALLSGLLDPIKSEQYLGKAEIRQVFKISGVGKVAGGFVVDGLLKRNAKIRLLRDNIVIHDGLLKTLKRFKEDAKEVKNGFECGFSVENYDDIKEGDFIECYEIKEEKREL